MNIHEIDLRTLLPTHHVVTEMVDGLLHVTTTTRLAVKFHREVGSLNCYASLPGAYKLPCRIDLTVKIDSPEFHLLIGRGHISFGTPWSANRRIDDIVEPTFKPRFFGNHIPMNEFVDISVIYDTHAMQILIDSEERFYSTKEKYMKASALKDYAGDGFQIALACSKRTELVIKSLRITEYDGTAHISHSEVSVAPSLKNEAAGEKPTFDTCISALPQELRDEVILTDTFLRALRPMKFRRQLETHGNKITYLASEYGFSYAIYPSNQVMHHSLGWYVITSCTPEHWHTKADLMETALNKISETSPELAERLFDNLAECIACATHCAVKRVYRFKGKQKLTCHGRMEFKMLLSDFADMRSFIGTINELVTEQK